MARRRTSEPNTRRRSLPQLTLSSATLPSSQAYSAGLIGSTPFVAWAGQHFDRRQPPLLIALVFMAAALFLFMFTDNYAAMVVSRVWQGCSGTGLWTLGLALITDSVPEQRVGTVMGQVMIGFSIGTSIGAPVGGVLYERLGYKAPFVFSLVLGEWRCDAQGSVAGGLIQCSSIPQYSSTLSFESLWSRRRTR